MAIETIGTDGEDDEVADPFPQGAQVSQAQGMLMARNDVGAEAARAILEAMAAAKGVPITVIARQIVGDR